MSSKVLVFTHLFPPKVGGGTLFVKNICDELSRRGYVVTVLTSSTKHHEESEPTQPYEVHRYSKRLRPTSLCAMGKTLQLHFRKRFDLVFLGHFISSHALGAIALRKLFGVPYVTLIHGRDLQYGARKRSQSWLAPAVLRNATLILTNSRFTAERVRELGYPGPMVILHPGTDIDRFRPGIDTSAVVHHYGLEGKKVILSVSNLIRRKGHENVLRALPRIIDKVPNVRYLIAGRGREETRLKSIAKALGVDHYLSFLGFVKEELLPALYCACDVFAMPSITLENGKAYEGFGIAFLEANACGKPVIGGRSGGISEAVVDGVTGLLVDPHNVDEIAAAMIRLLTDEAYARKLGENGRRRVENEFRWDVMGERLDRALQNVVRRR